MSQFVALRTKMRNKEVLLAALAQLGLDVKPEDVSDTAFEIRDMYGNRKAVAIAVRMDAQHKADCRSVYSDIGFVKEQDGTYTAWVDHLTKVPVKGEKSVTHVPIGQAVETAYKAVNGDRAMSKILTQTIPAWRKANKIPANATVKRVKQGSTSQLVLTFVQA